ncbi:MAG: hypothetical protein HYX27_05330 [Acidobacteria bacterium]|nr:hypothetical protein [Acidobacteriota bacterium]
MRTSTFLTLLAATMVPAGAQLPSLPTAPTLVTNRLAVVFMGDSYSAGEGAPNTSGPLWDDPDPCHRSKENGRAAVGNTLRNALAKRAVATATGIHYVYEFDYIDVACSGASSSKGILGAYNGVTPMRPSGPGAKRPDLPAQIQQAKDWMSSIGRNKIDVLVIGIGGNDVGFADAVAKCIDPFVADCSQNTGLLNLMEHGDPKRPEITGFDGLADSFTAMDTKIRAELNPSKIILVGYPLPLRNRYGAPCDGFVDNFSIYPNGDAYGYFENDVAGSPKHLTKHESEWLEAALIGRLNTARRNLTGPMGWDYLDVEQFSATHGFCETSSKAWFNTSKDSWYTQNDFNGTAHPNRQGYKLYQHFLLRKLARDLDVHISETPSGFNEEHSWILTQKSITPRTGPITENMQDRPPIIVNQDTYQEVIGSADPAVVFENEFTMLFHFLLNPTPNQVTETRLEVSMVDFNNDPAESQIHRYTPQAPLAQLGMLETRVPTVDYADGSTIYVRWRIKSRPFFDTTATPAVIYTPQVKYRVKGSSWPMVRL